VFAEIPNDRFLLETDTIEEGLEQVYEKAALVRNMSIQEIENIVSINFKSIFKNG
jgi:TatD DNase family protein